MQENMNASPQQIAAAAAAGVELLNIKDLPVPLGLSLGGHLGTLHAMLTAIARGELVVGNRVVPPPGNEAAGPDGEPPNLEGIEGGKTDEAS